MNEVENENEVEAVAETDEATAETDEATAETDEATAETVTDSETEEPTTETEEPTTETEEPTAETEEPTAETEEPTAETEEPTAETETEEPTAETEDDGEEIVVAEEELSAGSVIGETMSPEQQSLLEGVIRQVQPGNEAPELVICAQLFSAHKPLSIAELAANLAMGVEAVEAALSSLSETLRMSPFGVFRRSVRRKGPKSRPTTGYVLDLKPMFRRNVATVGRPVLGQGLTETLALIALNQPISQSRLVRERGSSVYEHVKELVARDWVQKYKAGRSYELRTTETFAAEFGLENDPALIKRALARAAGVEGAPEVVGSDRVLYEGETAPKLVAEAKAHEPSPAELARRRAVEAAREAALQALLQTEGLESQHLLRPDFGAAPAAEQAPASEGFAPLPQENCVVSGGQAPQPKQVEAEPSEEAASFHAGEGVVSGGAPPVRNRILQEIKEARMKREAEQKTTEQDTNEDSQGTSRVAHLLSLLDDEGTDDDW